MSPIDLAIEHAGSLTELAKRLKKSPQVVSNWRKRGIPTDMALDVERATDGAVTAAHILSDHRARKREARPS